MIKTPSSTVIGGAGIWTPSATIIGSISNLTQLIKSIFANNEQGFAYDPNDLTILYQDAAGTIPVTAAGQPVGLVLDKSRGLVLGVNAATTTNVVSVPIGGPAFTTYGIGSVVAGKMYKVSFTVTNFLGTGNVSLSGGTDVWSQNQSTTPNTNISGNGTVSFIANCILSSALVLFTRATNQCQFSNISVKELAGNHAFQTASASRPILQRNATTGAHYLALDGIDDFLVTNPINFTATDKVSLFAGVRKLSDVNSGIVAETSTRAGSNPGSFALYAPFDTTYKGYGIRSQGAVQSDALTTTPTSPNTSVVSGVMDITADKSVLRINGVQAASSLSDQGAGNYGNYPIYIGRRGGTSLPFNGHIYSLIGISRLTTDSETLALEKAIAKATGVTLNV